MFWLEEAANMALDRANELAASADRRERSGRRVWAYDLSLQSVAHIDARKRLLALAETERDRT